MRVADDSLGDCQNEDLGPWRAALRALQSVRNVELGGGGDGGGGGGGGGGVVEERGEAAVPWGGGGGGRGATGRAEVVS